MSDEIKQRQYNSVSSSYFRSE